MHDKKAFDDRSVSDDANECENHSSYEENEKDNAVSVGDDTPGKKKLRSWLNKNLKIEMTDGRILIGIFLCTDRDGNVILGSCGEYLKPEDGMSIEEPRILGLVMVPGRHIVSIYFDEGMDYSADVM